MNDRHAVTASWRIQCDALSVRRGKQLVLRDLSFTLTAGECVSLIGPNGAGKSTLLLALLGWLKPQAGRLTLDGTPIHALPARRRGRFAAYVPQLIERVPAFTIYDLVAGGRFPHVSPWRALSLPDHQIVAQALECCGLQALASRPITALSGGERQKALIAAAIAQDPELMLLDEPTTALDPAVQVELARLLRNWHAGGRALVVVSHELQLPAALGGRVLAMRNGRIVADGQAESVLRPQQLAAIFNAEFVSGRTPAGRQFVLPDWDRPAPAPLHSPPRRAT
jgi:iron complex transport system ATP-binding protein